MAAKQSAGLLLFRRREGQLQVFLVHPGGPLWAKKDDGAWSIPKGEYEDSEHPLETAFREFEEETGVPAASAIAGCCDKDEPDSARPTPIPLKPIRQPGGKVVHAWAAPGNLDAASVKSNDFVMEWPPKSGRLRLFPEVDRAGWFSLPEAEVKILKGQLPLLEELERILGAK